MVTRTVYLAGGIANLTTLQASGWRKTATRLLVAHGYKVLDPFRNDYRGVTMTRNLAAQCVEDDLRDIYASQIILAKADVASWGTAMELRAAKEMQKHVVLWGVDERISPWLLYHSHEQAATFEDAMRIMRVDMPRTGWYCHACQHFNDRATRACARCVTVVDDAGSPVMALSRAEDAVTTRRGR